jgi:phosphatidylserine/phosphatidylglycerophosphate/cardiolipin synthase-like enzyme
MIPLRLGKTVQRLKKHAGVAAELMNKLFLQQEQLFVEDELLSIIGFSKRSEALAVVKILIEDGILIKESDQLLSCAIKNEAAYFLSGVFSGIEYYESDRIPLIQSEIVLTYPRSPSTLLETLPKVGPRIGHIQNTDEIFSHLSRQAKHSIVILTPFLDSYGAALVMKLFKNVANTVNKTLILRFLKKDQNFNLYPKGFDDIRDELLDMGVAVHDYAIYREGSHLLETFHAKVVLVDDSMAYVGSSNMSQSSLDNSMELGVLIKGKPVRRVRDIMDTIMKISPSSHLYF